MKESRRAPVVCGATTAALFAALAAYIRVNLAYAGTWGQTLALSALFALTAGGAMAAYAALEKPDGRTLALVGGVMALTMAARVSMLDYISSDYQSFLVLWLDAFRKGGFATLGENVGDYNLIYQYILLLISKVPLKDLYLIKLFSVIFDYALALSMACLLYTSSSSSFSLMQKVASPLQTSATAASPAIILSFTSSTT